MVVFVLDSFINDEREKKLILTLEDVSLLEFLSSGSLAESPEVGGEKKKCHYF